MMMDILTTFSIPIVWSNGWKSRAFVLYVAHHYLHCNASAVVLNRPTVDLHTKHCKYIYEMNELSHQSKNEDSPN